MLIGFVIGVYDGALGPGTGSFFVLTPVGLMGYSFLEASAKAKIANLDAQPRGSPSSRPVVTSVAGRGRHGRGQRRRGLCRGSHRGVAREPLVRLVFIVVVSAFIVRIGGDLLGWW